MRRKYKLLSSGIIVRKNGQSFLYTRKDKTEKSSVVFQNQRMTGWINMENALLLIAFAGGFWALGNVFTYWLQDWFIFLPKKLPDDHVFQFKTSFEEHFLTTPDGGRINFLWFRSADKISSKGLVFYHHGNKGNLRRWGHYYHFFKKMDFDFVVYDYRGYGKSKGLRNEENMYSDARALFDLLTRTYPPEKIVLYGRSLGSAFASRLAAERPCRQLILETPFSGMRSLFYTYYPVLPRFFVFKYHFPNREHLRKATCPVLVFHGTSDWVVPYRCAAKLKSALKPGDEFITLSGARHHNVMHFDTYLQKMEQVLS